MTAGYVTVPADTELAVRDYLRTVDLDAATGRVFYDRPADGRHPFVVVEQIGGATDPNLPASADRLQVVVYGSHRAKRATRAIANLVIAHLSAVTPGGSQLDDVTVTGGPSFVPDRDAEMPRYVITAVAATRHTAI